MSMSRAALLTSVASLASALWAPAAEACGCFTPPDPTVPIVQAGERILFSVDNGQVTSHVQIQYQGEAAEFGWLLPLPSVPTLELGTDELFTALYAATQPKYHLNFNFESTCPQNRGGGFGFAQSAGAPSADSAGGTGGGAGQDPSPLVIQDSIGPYDYAVLKADSKDAMLDWLSTNHYFVPAGTDDTVSPYIHPGSFFLALKLRSGKSAGDLQPVVLHYASDAAMIPILLTSTGATENMGVQVWMLGPGRAIPRNYHHTVINDAVVNWQTAGANYNDVIIRAAGEAPGKHTFVTEYAGTSAVMRNVLNAPERFGTQIALANTTDATSFLQYLGSHGFGINGVVNSSGGFPGGFQTTFPAVLKTILAQYIPVPKSALDAKISADQYYLSYQYYGSQYPTTVDFQPAAMAQAIFDRVVAPTLAAGQLFDGQPVLTRLYTTISPQDMNKDPAFSFNRGLKDVANVHNATMSVGCDSLSGNEVSGSLVTEQGWNIIFPNGRSKAPTLDVSKMPASLRIEVLREEGEPELATDNGSIISNQVRKAAGCGCSTADAALMGLWPLALLLRRMRRRS